MSRKQAIAGAERYFDSGAFRVTSRAAWPSRPRARIPIGQRSFPPISTTRSSPRSRRWALPAGSWRTAWPFLWRSASRTPALPTVLGYGHGDVIRGLDDGWEEGLSPWPLTERERPLVRPRRRRQQGPARHQLRRAPRGARRRAARSASTPNTCSRWARRWARPDCANSAHGAQGRFRADVLIASDGPRLSADRPTLFLGSRGGITFDLRIDAREGGHHSGNWGGLLSDPGDPARPRDRDHRRADAARSASRNGCPKHPDSRAARARRLRVEPAAGGPTIDPDWGEPGLTPAENVFGWCSLRGPRLRGRQSRQRRSTPSRRAPGRAASFASSSASMPDEVRAGAAPPSRPPRLSDRRGRAGARRALRARRGSIPIIPGSDGRPIDRRDDRASAGDPAEPRRLAAERHLRRVLGLPTVWVPHSYPGCSQHAPNEHLPVAIAREGLAIMAGLYLGSRRAGYAGARLGRVSRARPLRGHRRNPREHCGGRAW